MIQVRLKIYGQVQGVGFRQNCERLAHKLEVVGYVRNAEDGAVEILAQGAEDKVNQLIEWAKKGPPLVRVEKVEIIERKGVEKLSFKNFEIW